jgi:hypothetical protein
MYFFPAPSNFATTTMAERSVEHNGAAGSGDGNIPISDSMASTTTETPLDNVTERWSRPRW